MSVNLFDKNSFKKTIEVLGLVVENTLLASTRKKLKSLVLNISRVKPIVNYDADSKLILLSPSLENSQIREIINNPVIIPYKIEVGYENLNSNQILETLLSDDTKGKKGEIPSSFETVGHVAHMNLPEEMNQRDKEIIAQVILDKNPSIRTVLTKVGVISDTFRNFQMQILAGDPSTLIELKEENCTFKFDYSKVYWNSRLQAEHRRIVELIKDGDYICDVFCGVGPFTIPAVKNKRKTIVYANDLNPESIYWLEENIKINKIKKQDRIHVYNMDGRDFIKNANRDLVTKYKVTGFDHYIMNLPAIAHQFLDVFTQEEINKKDGKGKEEIDTINSIIHCYVFGKKGEDPLINISSDNTKVINVHHVRTVSPNKEMYCISFKFVKNKKIKLLA